MRDGLAKVTKIFGMLDEVKQSDSDLHTRARWSLHCQTSEAHTCPNTRVPRPQGLVSSESLKKKNQTILMNMQFLDDVVGQVG